MLDFFKYIFEKEKCFKYIFEKEKFFKYIFERRNVFKYIFEKSTVKCKWIRRCWNPFVHVRVRVWLCVCMGVCICVCVCMCAIHTLPVVFQACYNHALCDPYVGERKMTVEE